MLHNHIIGLATDGSTNYYPMMLRKYTYNARWSSTQKSEYKHRWLPYGHKLADEYYVFDGNTNVPIGICSDNDDHIVIASQITGEDIKLHTFRRSFYEVELNAVTLSNSEISGYDAHDIACYWRNPDPYFVVVYTDGCDIFLKFWECDGTEINVGSTNQMVTTIEGFTSGSGTISLAFKNKGYTSSMQKRKIYVNDAFSATGSRIYEISINMSAIPSVVAAGDIKIMNIEPGTREVPTGIAYDETDGELYSYDMTDKFIDIEFKASTTIDTDDTMYLKYSDHSSHSGITYTSFFGNGFETPIMSNMEMTKSAVGFIDYYKSTEKHEIYID
jgi:hypothetical protein